MSVFSPSYLLDLFGEPVKDRRARVHEADSFNDYIPSELWNAKIFRIFMLSDKDPSEVHFLERATCTDGTFIWVFTEPKRYLPTSSNGRINITGACIYTPSAEKIFNGIKEHYSKESNGYTELKSVPGDFPTSDEDYVDLSGLHLPDKFDEVSTSKFEPLFVFLNDLQLYEFDGRRENGVLVTALESKPLNGKSWYQEDEERSLVVALWDAMK
ncbi:hypothetical protein HDV62DRAFT_387489 [Trichoderma sp. SZMC 28011]